MRRLLVMLAILMTAVVAAPAFAHDGRGAGVSAPEKSVFPVPRDPYRSWGVRSDPPRRVDPPRVQSHDGFRRHERETVWIPGHWAWNGATWVWWPGHWGVR
jgi:hypothetical protein